MKNINVIIFSLIFTLAIFSLPENVTGNTYKGMIDKAEMPEETREPELWNDTVSVGKMRTDTTAISLGNRQIIIIDKNGTTDISIFEREKPDSDISFRRTRPFKGNWRGLELGFNNYLNSNFSISLDPGDDFMELRAARSWNVNLNLIQYSLSVSGNNAGLVTGLGFEFNNYHFSNNVSITKENRVIVPVEYDDLDKSRLRAVYLNVPLLMEFQTNHPRRSRRAYFSAGVVGGVNIGSSTKVVYRDDSGKSRDKVRDDFYLSPFRYGLSFRAGYRALNIFATYYPTPLFQKNKGPELYPFAVGFSILGF